MSEESILRSMMTEAERKEQEANKALIKKALWVLLFSCLGLYAICVPFLITSAAPTAGQEAVLIDKPWLPKVAGGIRPEPVKNGREWLWKSTEIIYVNVLPQQFDIEYKDMMSADGVPLDYNASIRLQITDSVSMVGNFGQNWYDNNVQKEFEKFVRDEVKQHDMQQAAIDNTASDLIDKNVTEALEAYLTNIKLPVRLISVTLGKANPPDGVKDQRIETSRQEQRKITEDKREAAEKSRKLAELARAESDNAYRNKMNLSPELFVELEKIKMMCTVCKDGNHCTFINGNATPVITTK